MNPLVPKQEDAHSFMSQQQPPLQPAIVPLAPVDQLEACQGMPAGGLEQHDEGMQPVKREEAEQNIGMEAQTPSLDPNPAQPPPPLAQPRTTTPEMSPGPSSIPPGTSSISVVPLTQAALQALPDTTGIFDDPEEDSLSKASTSIAEGADPKRRTVLFPKDEEKDFPSSSAFFSSCRKRLKHMYGLATHVCFVKPTAATARCSRRTTEEKCKFTVRAALVDGRWIVRREKCIWTHSHDPPVGWESSDGDRSETSEEERVVVKKPRLNKAPAQPRPSTNAGVDSLSWTAKTESRDMLELVKNREIVLEKQRQMRSDLRFSLYTAIAQNDLAKYVSGLSTANKVFPANVDKYRDFCAEVDIPFFPLTPPIIALAVFHRCSVRNSSYTTYRSDLYRLMKLTSQNWDTVPGYFQLRDWDGAGDALLEFMDERKHVKTRGIDRTQLPPSGPKPATSHARDEYYESDEASSVAPESNKDDSSVHGSDLDLDSEGEGEAESSHESEDDEEEIEVLDLRYETSEGGGSSRGGGRSASSSRPTVPFSTSTVYPSMRAMYLALVVAMIPAYGLSVSLMNNSSIICNRQHPHYAHRPGGTCPYTMYATQRDDGWVVDLERSRMKHNHGPDPRIVKDPSWRPVVRNPDARAALGMPPLASSTSSTTKSKAAKGKGKEKESKPPKAKKERTQEQIERDRASMAHARQAKVEKRERQKESEMSGTHPPPEKKPRLSSSSATPGPSSFSALAVPHSAFEPHPLYPYSYPSAGPPSYPPPPPQAYPLRPSPAPPALTPHVPRPPPPPSSLSITHLSAFLHFLHPSLSPLAASFLATGLDSIDALASLALLEPHTLDGLVDIVRAKSEAGGGARMSVIQGKLFVKKLRDAFAAGPR